MNSLGKSISNKRKKNIIGGMVLALVFFLSAAVYLGTASASFQPLDLGWEFRDIPHDNLNSVAWSEDDNIFVAVGNDGSILSSPDGETWSRNVEGSQSYIGRNLNSVIWDQLIKSSGFIAVGDEGRVLISGDGEEWLREDIETKENLNDVSTNGEVIVAVGTNGAIFRRGLTTWEDVSYSENDLFGVHWTGESFVAVGEDGTVLRSPNGSNWEEANSGVGADLNSLDQQEFVGDGARLIAVGMKGTIITSTDQGISWEDVESNTDVDLYDVEDYNNEFMAVGGSIVLTSELGTHWEEEPAGAGNHRGIARKTDMVVVVGTEGNIISKTGNENWEFHSNSQNPTHLKGIVFGGEKDIVAVGVTKFILELDPIDPISPFEQDPAERSIFKSSADGETWERRMKFDTPGLNSIDLAGPRGADDYVAVGDSGTIIVSHDLEEMDTYITEQEEDLYDVLDWRLRLTGRRLAVVGAGANFLTSDNRGESWTVREEGGIIDFHGMTKHENLVIVADNRLIFYSDDHGENLYQASFIQTLDLSVANVDSNLYGVTHRHDPQMMVAVGENGAVFTSDDQGEWWRSRSSGTKNHLYDVAWTGNVFVAVGAEGTILTSPDGINWTDNYSGTTNDLHAVDSDDHQVIIVGDNNITLGAENRAFGTLDVSIEPQEAEDMGARWSVDGGSTWYESGSQVMPEGTYTVTFKALSGWDAPSDVTVEVNEGETATASGTYEIQPGTLVLTITPEAAREAGARWQVEGETEWLESGEEVELEEGNYTVIFNEVEGWDQPDDLNVTVEEGETVSKSGMYVEHVPPDASGLIVTITPEAAREAGARWQVEGETEWLESGEWAELEAGDYTVIFKEVEGWDQPDHLNVTVEEDETATASGTYEIQAGTLVVTITPEAAREAGAEWQVEGETGWLDSGEEVELEAGNYTVIFKEVEGWDQPDQLNVTVEEGETVSESGTYTQHIPPDASGLVVAIEPEEAREAGARWQVEGETGWLESEDLAELEAGDYTVIFKEVEGWDPPADLTVTVEEDDLTFKSVSYTCLVRIAGEGRFQTAVEISLTAFPSKNSADAVVLARGDEFPDALAGVPLAYDRNGPLLLTLTDSLQEDTAAEINRVLPEDGTIYILGGTAAISDEVMQELSDEGYTVERLSGLGRFETAIAVAEELIKSPTASAEEVFLATGFDFPDALAASSPAALRHAPILLTRTEQLPECTADFLEEHTPNIVYTIGGENVIDESVHDEAEGTHRIGGVGRFETSINIAEFFFEVPEPESVVMATGFNFPDALSGGVYAAYLRAPMILTSDEELRELVADYFSVQENIRRVILLGGSGVISENVEEEIKDRFLN